MSERWSRTLEVSIYTNNNGKCLIYFDISVLENNILSYIYYVLCNEVFGFVCSR